MLEGLLFNSLQATHMLYAWPNYINCLVTYFSLYQANTECANIVNFCALDNKTQYSVLSQEIDLSRGHHHHHDHDYDHQHHCHHRK